MADYNKTKEAAPKDRLSLISLLLAAIAAAGFIALLCSLYLTDRIDVFQSRQESGFARVEDISCREYSAADTPIGVVREYTFALDAPLSGDVHLAFYTVHQYAAVYLDGELVYSLRPAGENRISRTVGSNWVMIPLYSEDEGKEVRVEITPVYESFRDREVEFLIGSSMAIYAHRLFLDLPQLVLSILTVFVGLVFLAISFYTLYKKRRGADLAALGLFSAMMGLWHLTDTRFTPFACPDQPVILFYTSIAMLMLGIVPLIRTVRKPLNPASRRILDWCCVGASCVCLIQVFMQFCGIMDLRENLIVTHILIIFCIATVCITTIYDRVKYAKTRKRYRGEKLPFLLVAGILADIAAFYIKGNSSGLLFSLLAFLLYIVFLGITMMLYYNEQEKRLLEKEVELANSRVSIMLSQIKPHFLYNTLTSISSLCKDAPQAREALRDFSSYLRGNMDSLNSRDLIRFPQELRHIETYLKLEKLRFGEKLNVVYDIQETDFFLPPLTIQPLVENAVKHGICCKRGSGTLTLRTRRDGNRIVITVEDDGVGFDPAQPEVNGQSHVGIRNVRERLLQMAGGVLTIESIPGAGTTATVVLDTSVQTR